MPINPNSSRLVYDRKILDLIASVADNQSRTYLETVSERGSQAFGRGISSVPINLDYLTVPASEEDINATVDMIIYHSQRLGLSLATLKSMVDTLWAENGREEGKGRNVSESVRVTPAKLTTLGSKVRNRPRKGK